MSILDNIRDLQAKNSQRKIANRFKLGIIHPDELKAKKGQTFFILGSGGTINELNQSHWDAINVGFSVGMNKWLIHDFIPNATSLEKNWHKELYEKLYADERLINSQFEYLFYPATNIKENNGFPFSVRKEVLSKIRLHSGARKILRSRKELDDFHEAGDLLKLVRIKLEQGLNYEQKGSVYRLVQFALGAGFKHIVFCGVDLNNVAYFWENSSFLEKRGISNLDFRDQKGSIHATEIKSNSSLPISEVLQSLQIALKGKVLFETSSRNSKLSEFLSVWTPPKQL